MKTSILITLAISLSGAVSKSLSSRSILNDEIDAHSETEVFEPNWVTIKARKNEIKAFAGESIELECEASGSPQPLIQFHKSGSDLTNEAITSNELSQYTNTGLVKAIAKLHLIARKTQTVFCKATSGGQTAQAKIKIFVSDTQLHQLENEVWEYERKEVSIKAMAPIISFFDTIYMDDIGNTVVMPCTVNSKRESKIVWLNPNEDVIENDERLTITPFGELKIRNVQWNDMGLYTCVATNDFGKDKISTFLYPMLAEK